MICVCAFCHKDYKPKASNRVRYCSRDCFFAHCKKRLAEHNKADVTAIIIMPCACCRTVFVRRAKSARAYCSELCRFRANFTPKPPREYSCSCCGVKFTRQGQGTPPPNRLPYCSKKCCTKAQRRKDRLNGKRACRNGIRAQRLRAQTVESVSPARVFVRDNWTCWLCNQQCNPKAMIPDPLFPTVDHVIPISKGGEHSYANCRCACFACNCKKRDVLVSV